MERLRAVPVRLLAVLAALVVVATGNLSALGIGARSLLYDAEALPRLAVTLVLVAAAWAAWWALTARGGETTLRIDVVWGLLGGLAGWAVLSAAVSQHRLLAVLGQSERLEGAVTVIAYALVYGIALQAVRGVSDVRLIAVAFVSAACVLSVAGLLQFAGFDPTDYAPVVIGFDPRRAFASFGNPNFFASLLVLAGPVAGGLAATARGRGGRLGWALSVVLIEAALFVTFTRAAWIAAAVQFVVAVVVWRRAGGRIDGAVRTAAIAGVAALGVLAAVSLTTGAETNLLSRLSDAAALSGSAAERIEVATTAVAAAASRPVLGWGPDAFLPAFRAHRTDGFAAASGSFATINNAHSWPLQYAVTLGFPGALALLAAVFAALARTRTHLSARSVAKPAGPLMAAVWIACLGFALNMLLGVAVLGATVPFWLLLGAMAAPVSRGVRVAGRATRAGAVLATAVLIAAVAGSALLVTADVTYLASRSAYHEGDGIGAARLAEKAHRLNPFSVKYDRGAAQAAGLSVGRAIALGEGPEAVRAAYEAADRRFLQFLRRHPEDYAARAWLAALRVETSEYLDDAGIRQSAVALAAYAGRLDRQNAALAELAGGDTSSLTAAGAAAVPALP